MMNYMVEQINNLPDLLNQIFHPLDEKIRSKFDGDLCLRLERLFVVGCGDSHNAALGSELSFESLTGIATEPMNSMTFARYVAGFVPKTDLKTNLVLGISVSGAVARTIEALKMSTQAGIATVAITTNPDSSLAKAAQVLLDVPVPQNPKHEGMAIPGIHSYFINQIALALIAVRMAEVRGELNDTEAENIRTEILNLALKIEQTIEECDPIVKQAVLEFKKSKEYVFVGSGPNFATALFSAAKVLEASGDSALGQDVEEWAHLQYFAREIETPTIIISAGERDLSRVEEVGAAAKKIGRSLAVISPKSASGLNKLADFHFPVPHVKEMFSPIITAIPGELFAAYRAELIDEPYFRGFSGGRSIEEGGGISRIRTSEIWKNWKP